MWQSIRQPIILRLRVSYLIASSGPRACTAGCRNKVIKSLAGASQTTGSSDIHSDAVAVNNSHNDVEGNGFGIQCWVDTLPLRHARKWIYGDRMKTSLKIVPLTCPHV